MKKICHMTIVETGAIPRILRETETALKLGLEVFIVCLAKADKEYKKKNINFIEVQKSDNRVGRVLQCDQKVYQAARGIDADIYQIHDPELLRYSTRLLKDGKKVIFDSHEFYRIQIMEKPYIPSVFRKFIAVSYNYYEAYYCNKVNAVLSVCTVNGKSYFADRCKKEIVVGNMPVLMSDDFVKNDYTTTKRVIYAGLISYDRGALYLAKAAKLAGITLVLCGYFSSDEIKNKLLGGEYSENIEYKGVLTREELYKLYQTCDIGASTLLSVGQYHSIDTLPTKVYEYMMTGLPVVMTKTRFNHFMNKKYNFGICVSPDNAEEIAAAFKTLMEEPEKMRLLGRNGRTAVEGALNWGTQEKELEELYLGV